MACSKKLWFLSFPYLMGVLCGLVVLLAHPLVLKPLYRWRVDVAPQSDALRLIQALRETTPVRELNTQLAHPLTLEELTYFETLRSFLSNLSSWSIGLLAFALVLLLLERKSTWGQLHRRSSCLLLGLLVTLAVYVYFQFSSSGTSILRAPMQALNTFLLNSQAMAPGSILRGLFPAAFWNALSLLYAACALILFILFPLLYRSKSSSQEA